MRARYEADGADRADALAHEAGFLMGCIEGLCAQLEAWAGIDLPAAQPGCDFTTVWAGDTELTVEYEFTPGQRERIYGEPENCYPELPPECNVINVLINGSWVDPRDLFSETVVSRWEDKICEDMMETQ
jgi:hypothetical protein